MTQPRSESPRVVVVHDYLTQRGGAERVVLALMTAFPEARLLTSIYDPDTTFDEFRQYRVETMWLSRFGVFRRDPRRAMPLLARAFSRHDLRDADVVVSSTSGWAHGIAGDMPKVVYCHNPARWLYQPSDYFAGRPDVVTRTFLRATAPLRGWDRRSADATSLYFANSTAVRERVADVYGIDAALLPPPASLDPHGPQEPVPGLEPGFLLTVSRRRAYKNTVLACQAVESLDGVRLVAVGGLPDKPDGGAWDSRLQGRQDLSDAQMRWLYASCRGVVAVSREDFGLTPVEGYSFGKPAAVLRAGGYLDSAAPGVASVFIDEPTIEATCRGITGLLGRSWDEAAVCAHAERFGLAHFQERLRDAVASVVAEPRRPRRTGGSTSGPHPSRRAEDRAGGRAGTPAQRGQGAPQRGPSAVRQAG